MNWVGQNGQPTTGWWSAALNNAPSATYITPIVNQANIGSSKPTRGSGAAKSMARQRAKSKRAHAKAVARGREPQLPPPTRQPRRLPGAARLPCYRNGR